MKCFLFWVSLCFFATSLNAQDASAIISRVKTRLDKVNNYSSIGSLELDVEFIKMPASKVEIFFKKPDQFKIKSTDGLSILPKGGFSINLQTLLSGSQYTSVKVGTGKVGIYEVDIVKLIPLEENNDLLVATLYIDTKEPLIRKSITSTRSKGTVEMDMTYGRYAQWGLPDKVTILFSTKEYKLPKGISFDYNPGGSTTKKPSTGKGKVEMVYENYQINKGISESVFK